MAMKGKKPTFAETNRAKKAQKLSRGFGSRDQGPAPGTFKVLLGELKKKTRF